MTKRRIRVVAAIESGVDVRLVDGLAARTDLSILGRTVPAGHVVSREPSAALPVRTLPASRIGFAARVFAHLAARSGRYDAVLVQGYGPAALAANLASWLTRRPTTMLICSPIERYYRCRQHHSTSDKPYRLWEDKLIRLVARLNARLGRRYVVLSEHLAGVVREHGTHLPVHVIPVYGVDANVFAPGPEPKAETRARLGLPAAGRLIFFSSRIAPEKDAETLLAAFRALDTSRRDAWIVHLSGGYRRFVEAAERHGVADRVVARDAVHPTEELPEYYRACDVCVQASWEEGLGFSPLEALACGVPVVAAAVGGLVETIRPPDTGWTYPPGDVPALAACLQEVLGHPDEARRRSTAGRAMVRERFESRVVMDRLAALLSEHHDPVTAH